MEGDGKIERALSIQQPWLDRILFEGKDIENRTWCLPYWMKGKRIYLHAGKRPLEGYSDKNRLGALLGSAIVKECVHYSDSPWFDGPHGFVLEDVREFPIPIPWKGALGFWKIDVLSRGMP